METGSNGTDGKATKKKNYLEKHQRDAILASLPAHIWIQAKNKTVLYSNRPSYLLLSFYSMDIVIKDNHIVKTMEHVVVVM